MSSFNDDTAFDLAQGASIKILDVLNEHRKNLMEIGMEESAACVSSVLPVAYVLRGYRETAKEFFGIEAVEMINSLIDEVRQ